MPPRLRIIPAQPQHLDSLARALRPQDQRELLMTLDHDHIRAALESFLPQNPQSFAQVAMLDDKPIALMAAQRLFSGHYALGFVAHKDWLMTNARKVTLHIARHLRRQLRKVLIAQGARKACCMVLRDDLTSTAESAERLKMNKQLRWLNFLGLEQEARLKAQSKYGQDVDLFSIFFSEQNSQQTEVPLCHKASPLASTTKIKPALSKRARKRAMALQRKAQKRHKSLAPDGTS